ncbi:hypothetical protein MFIFM68171_09495 [Madurella fahalii]|uniref:Uncharacterized protein n=1 Tax=Madurella fahalii TaxID=1157608 RepID=A0ABQ0GNI6_9PEZI
MQFSSNFLLWGFLHSSAAPAPDPQFTAPPVLTVPVPGGPLPPSCLGPHDGVGLKPTCYTYTETTVPATCPKIKCPAPTKPVYCPMYIKIETLSVPCHNECCPHTPTKYVPTSCPTCTTGCVIPTETVTVTTGCPKVPGPRITPTATLHVP